MRSSSTKAGASPRRWLALAILQAVQGFVLRRWLLLPVAFAMFALFIKNRASFDYAHQARIEINLWDLLPSMLANQKVTLWAYALGFALLAGDGLARARASGAATLVLIRAPSRAAWWASRCAAMGLQAVCFVAASTAIVLAVGALVLPLSLDPSPGARALTGGAMLYPRPTSWPMPAFTLAIAVRAGLGLWLLGCLLELAALLFPRRPLAPFLVVVGWIFVTLGVLPGISSEGPTRWLDLAHLISYADHLGPAGLGFPAGTFLLGWLAAMSAVLSLGAWRLRHLDL